MRIAILAVGRARAGPERALFDDYVGRLKWPVTVVEIAAPAGRLTSGEARRREAELFASRTPKGARLIALDPAGRTLSSEEFAARLGSWRDHDADLAFLIGGAVGLDPALVARSDLVLSFGKMIWPHLLARVMLAEQLFRAHSILAGHPYHRGGKPD